MKTLKTMDHFPKKHLQVLLAAGLLGAAVLLFPSSKSPVEESKPASPIQPISDDTSGHLVQQPAVSAPEAAVVAPVAQIDNPSNNGVVESQPAEEPSITWLSKIVQKGDSLSSLLARAGISPNELHEIMSTAKSKAAKALTTLHPGQKVEISVDDNQKLNQLRFILSPIETLEVTKADDGSYEFEKVYKKYDVQIQHTQVSIQQSLFFDAQNAGLDSSIIMKLAEIFEYDIDFALGLRAGDSLDVIYEELYLDGKKQKNGRVLAANFFNKGKRYSAVYYQKPKQDVGSYYTENGETMRKAFIQSPVDFARISSHFNLKRRHPILHTIRAHKGVDYAASVGTPVKATGDGRVMLANQKGGYGKTIILKHAGNYTTLYGHLSGYAQGIRSGKEVRQGQVIGYVGTTGMSTGPHLHYEFHVNGMYTNPLTVKLPRSIPLGGKDKQNFFASTSELRNQLATYASQRAVALNGR